MPPGEAAPVLATMLGLVAVLGVGLGLGLVRTELMLPMGVVTPVLMPLVLGVLQKLPLTAVLVLVVLVLHGLLLTAVLGLLGTLTPLTLVEVVLTLELMPSALALAELAPVALV